MIATLTIEIDGGSAEVIEFADMATLIDCAVNEHGLPITAFGKGPAGRSKTSYSFQGFHYTWSETTERGSKIMKKLSPAMETMVRGATRHQVRQGGRVVHTGMMVTGRTNTLVALIERGLITTMTGATFGEHWLTESGMEIYASLTGKTVRVDFFDAAPEVTEDDDVVTVTPITTTTDETLALLSAMTDAGMHALPGGEAVPFRAGKGGKRVKHARTWRKP